MRHIIFGGSTWKHTVITCFILSKRDDVFKVTVDELGESAGLVSPHANLIVLPCTSGDILFKRHQTPERKRTAQIYTSIPINTLTYNISMYSNDVAVTSLKT